MPATAITDGRIYIKAWYAKSQQKEDGRKVHTFTASTDAEDRQQEVVVQDWELANYRANSVVLDSHDYRSIENIVGVATDVRATEKSLEADIVFNGTPKGRLADQLVEEGNLKAVSVGFISREAQADAKGKGPLKRLKNELLEISVCAVPANPEALLQRQYKRPIPFRAMPCDDEAAEWDAGAEMRSASVEDLKTMCAWYDAENPDVKSSYKLPHHRAESHHTVWRAVAAAMAALMGARGGAQIPDGDRKGVYNHLARHYQEFEKTPPEFKTLDELSLLGPIELKGLFWEDEVEEGDFVVKVGRRLSAKSKQTIQQAIELLNGLLAEEAQADEGEPTAGDQDKALAVDLEALFQFASQK